MPRAALLAVLLVPLTLLALGLGDYSLSVPEVGRAMVTDQGFASTVVREWRLPRVLAALLVGAALGASGAVFQTLTRNPLGSPDVIGFSTGAYTGAVVSFTVLGTGRTGASAGALVGGLATALVVYVLAWRGGVQGFRLIVVGIAVTAMLSSLNTWLLLRAQTEVAMAASIWGAGSLALVDAPAVALMAGPLGVLGLAVALLAGHLRQLELGDDAASSHGVPVERTRLLLLVTGVALVAVVTAAAGPIAFVALCAPQIARRLLGGAGIPLAGAALVGAGLLLGADMAAQHLLPGAMPVGVVTVVLGGGYLVALLAREGRRLS